MKIWHKIAMVFFLGLLSGATYGQFYTYGTIKYERTYNMKQAVQLEETFSYMRQFSKQLPETMKSYYTLRFDQNRTEFNYVKDSAENKSGGGFRMMGGGMGLATENQVWTDLNKEVQNTIKEIFENTYYITDSLQGYEWKIEDDVRTIAGYPCRKAITRIHDSVVVVAFYADQIMVSGGPESFHGLPGMILGLAIPRLYTTWYATDVTILKPEMSTPEKPKKAKEVNRQGFLKDISSGTKSWRRFGGDQMIWQATL